GLIWLATALFTVAFMKVKFTVRLLLQGLLVSPRKVFEVSVPITSPLAGLVPPTKAGLPGPGETKAESGVALLTEAKFRSPPGIDRVTFPSDAAPAVLCASVTANVGLKVLAADTGWPPSCADKKTATPKAAKTKRIRGIQRVNWRRRCPLTIGLLSWQGPNANQLRSCAVSTLRFSGQAVNPQRSSQWGKKVI